MMPCVRPVWYRYEEVRYSLGLDAYDEPLPGYRLDVVLRKYPVLRPTPKGVWLDMGFESKRLVLRHWHKKFACETEKDARESFIARKKRQLAILRAQVAQAEEALRFMELDEGLVLLSGAVLK